MSDVLSRIVDANLCHGCGGCVAVLPTGRAKMAMTKAGYLRPQAMMPLSPDDTRTVEAVCSGIAVDHEASAIPVDTIWGPLVASRTGHATDEAIRHTGSSGGVLSAMALHLIRNGLADYILHVAADEADPFGNIARPSKDRDGILAAAGSRYVPSSPLADIERHLASGARFAVIAKPCDIATLRRMGRRDPRIAAQIPLMMSFFCAGIPSRNDALAVPRAMGAEPDAVVRFAFRGEGWPGFARARLKDGRELRMSYNESWGKILNRHLQFRCKICPDGTGEFADIVCGDAWYGEDGYPDFSERPGRSLVLTRSARGEGLLRAAEGAGDVTLEPLDPVEIRAMQPYQTLRKRTVLARVTGLMLAGRRAPRYRRLGLLGAARQAGARLFVRSMAGTFMRALLRRTDERDGPAR